MFKMYTIILDFFMICQTIECNLGILNIYYTQSTLNFFRLLDCFLEKLELVYTLKNIQRQRFNSQPI